MSGTVLHCPKGAMTTTILLCKRHASSFLLRCLSPSLTVGAGLGLVRAMGLERAGPGKVNAGHRQWGHLQAHAMVPSRSHCCYDVILIFRASYTSSLYSTKMTSTLAQPIRRRTEDMGRSFLTAYYREQAAAFFLQVPSNNEPKRANRRRYLPCDSTRALPSSFLGSRIS